MTDYGIVFQRFTSLLRRLRPFTTPYYWTWDLDWTYREMKHLLSLQNLIVDHPVFKNKSNNPKPAQLQNNNNNNEDDKKSDKKDDNITGIGNTIITSRVSPTTTVNDTTADDDNNDED
ncbi:unnamed protein product [Rotaria sp. Silwood1]|nr:unnamed protein product [Rotaria sp. Silwood1]